MCSRPPLHRIEHAHTHKKTTSKQTHQPTILQANFTHQQPPTTHIHTTFSISPLTPMCLPPPPPHTHTHTHTRQCNDCGWKGIADYHYFGISCGECTSFNTVVLESIDFPTMEEVRSLSTTLPDHFAAASAASGHSEPMDQSADDASTSESESESESEQAEQESEQQQPPEDADGAGEAE
jgi:Zinc-ribbon